MRKKGNNNFDTNAIHSVNTPFLKVDVREKWPIPRAPSVREIANSIHVGKSRAGMTFLTIFPHSVREYSEKCHSCTTLANVYGIGYFA
ncbi:MAG TPA: hypothetical protein VGC87_24805, partial [Pyrinomonadaceae bacterium]